MAPFDEASCQTRTHVKIAPATLTSISITGAETSLFAASPDLGRL